MLNYSVAELRIKKNSPISLKTLLMLEEELGKVGINFFLLYHFYVLTIVPKS